MNLHALSFTGCVALLLAHELDAVYRKEWRLLPVLRGMRDEVAVFAFILIHVPLIVALIGSGRSRSSFGILKCGCYIFKTRSQLRHPSGGPLRGHGGGAGGCAIDLAPISFEALDEIDHFCEPDGFDEV